MPAALLLVLALSGCGTAEQEAGTTDNGVPSVPVGQETDTTPGTDPSASGSDRDSSAVGLPPGPSLPPDPQVAPDQLALSNAGEDDLAAVAEEGGRVIESDERLGLHVVELPVDSIDELVAARDRLRARGVDATVVTVIEDPTSEG